MENMISGKIEYDLFSQCTFTTIFQKIEGIENVPKL